MLLTNSDCRTLDVVNVLSIAFRVVTAMGLLNNLLGLSPRALVNERDLLHAVHIFFNDELTPKGLACMEKNYGCELV